MKQLKLTPDEVIAIEFVTSMRPDTSTRHVSKSLILRIGRELLSATPELEVDEDDLWAIRDYVDIYQRSGRELVGLTIKQKVYQLLCEFELEKAFGIPVSEVDEYVSRSTSQSTSQSASQNTDASQKA